VDRYKNTHTRERKFIHNQHNFKGWNWEDKLIKIVCEFLWKYTMARKLDGSEMVVYDR